MRLLFFSNLYATRREPGRGSFSVRLVNEIRAAGHAVHVVVAVPRADEAPDGDPAIEVLRWWRPPRIRRDLWHHWMWWSTREPLRRSVRDFQPDVIWSTWVHPDGAVGCRLAREFHLPTVTSAVGSDLLQVSDRRRLRAIAGVLRASDLIFTDGEHLRRVAIGLGALPARTAAIVRGVDPRVFSPGDAEAARRDLGLPDQGIVLLSVGNLVPVKGIDVLVDALATPHLRAREWMWIHIGDGPERGRIEGRIRHHGLESRCRLVGTIPHQNLPEWYRAATLQVLPSRSEGVPNVLLEGMATGLPFVASAVGGVPEIAPDLSWCVRPDDPIALAETLARVLDDPPALTQQVPASRDVVLTMLQRIDEIRSPS